jgi:hypothetical protein
MIFPGLDTSVEIKDVTKNLEMGLSLGSGISIPINSMNLFLTADIPQGL